HGHGASPIVYGEMVIVANEQDGPGSIIAFDRKKGQTKWNVARDGREASYATPTVVEEPGRVPQLICISGVQGITSLDPATGKLNWKTGKFPMRTVASPVVGEGVVLGSCGSGGSGGVLLRAVDL